MATNKADARTQVRFSISLPEPLYDRYAVRAAQYNRTPEEEIVLRLQRCADHTADTPIYLNDQDRKELCALTGKLIANSTSLVQFVRNLMSLQVEHVEVPLSEQLVSRLKTRQFGHTWPEHIRYHVVDALEQFVGLR